MFLDLEWYWWFIIIVLLVILIPVKIKFIQWWSKHQKEQNKDKNRKWGNDE